MKTEAARAPFVPKTRLFSAIPSLAEHVRVSAREGDVLWGPFVL